MKQVDVLFINPISRENPPAYLPYGILLVAAYLRENGYEVKIYDRNADKTHPTKILKKYNPRIVSFSVLTGPPINDAASVSRIVKKEMPDTPIVWGGLHPTFFGDHCLRENYIDYIIKSEGEFAMLQLVDFLLKKKGDLAKIKSIGYKKDSKIKQNQLGDFIEDLTSMPMPAWDLIDMEKYVQSRFYAGRIVTINTSRGCPFRCKFCFNQILNKGRWRGISAERIFEQFKLLKDGYKMTGIQIYDDNFDAGTKRLKEFCDILIREDMDIKWHHFSRVNYTNRERIAMEKKAGCCMLEFGVESGSPRILEFIQKDETVEMIKRAFKICKDQGMYSSALFMVGIPTETIEDVNMTIKLVDSLGAHQTIGTIYKPYPNTPLYDHCVKQGRFKLPDKIEEQGKIYSLSDDELNMTDLPTEFLVNVQRRFFFQNALNEIKSCLRYRNFSLLGYHIRTHMNIGNISNYSKAAVGYVKSKIKEKAD